MRSFNEFARVVITKRHRLSGLNNRNIVSHNFGGWKFKIKVLAQWFPLRPLSWVCRWPPSSVSSHDLPSA